MLHPGALGLGQSIASLALNCVVLLSYITPVPAAVIADQYLGRYKTLLLAFTCDTSIPVMNWLLVEKRGG